MRKGVGGVASRLIPIQQWQQQNKTNNGPHFPFFFSFFVILPARHVNIFFTLICQRRRRVELRLRRWRRWRRVLF